MTRSIVKKTSRTLVNVRAASRATPGRRGIRGVGVAGGSARDSGSKLAPLAANGSPQKEASKRDDWNSRHRRSRQHAYILSGRQVRYVIRWGVAGTCSRRVVPTSWPPICAAPFVYDLLSHSVVAFPIVRCGLRPLAGGMCSCLFSSATPFAAPIHCALQIWTQT